MRTIKCCDLIIEPNYTSVDIAAENKSDSNPNYDHQLLLSKSRPALFSGFMAKSVAKINSPDEPFKVLVLIDENGKVKDKKDDWAALPCPKHCPDKPPKEREGICNGARGVLVQIKESIVIEGVDCNFKFITLDINPNITNTQLNDRSWTLVNIRKKTGGTLGSIQPALIKVDEHGIIQDGNDDIVYVL